MTVGNIQGSVSEIVAAPVTVAPVSKASAAPADSSSSSSSSNSNDSDAVNLSATALVLNSLQYQLYTSRPSEFKGLLEGAADSISNAAQLNGGHEQANALESIAARLRFAANIAGLSGRTSLSISSLL